MIKTVFKRWEHPNDKIIDTSKYSFVRVYHGCRPISIESYLKKGLWPLSKDSALNMTLEYLEGIFSRKTIISSFDKFWKNQNYNKYIPNIFFSLDKKPLCGKARINCSHYMIYGSELIQSVAASIDFDLFHSIPLSQLPGVPTVITCDIPIELVEPECLKIVGIHTIDGFRTKAVDSEYIVRIEHPKGTVFDSILQQYRNLNK